MSAVYVYEVYNAEQTCIYIGCSRDVPARMRQHQTASWWAPQAVKVRARVHLDRDAARAAEQSAIRTKLPLWNIHHLAGRHSWTAERYVNYILARTHRYVSTQFFNPRSAHYRQLRWEYRNRFGRDLIEDVAASPHCVGAGTLSAFDDADISTAVAS